MQDMNTDAVRDELVKALMDSVLASNPGLTPLGPEGLTRRYLPPGKWADVYRLYMASCFEAQQPCASSSSFFRVLNESGWRKKLRPRGATTHAKCSVCHALKSAIKCSKDLATHAVAADQYMRHLAGQFADRRTYWQMRSRASQEKDTLVLIVDSMDKSKFKLPRYPDGVCPKSLEKRSRPECELTACIVHGRGVYIYIADPEQSFGSDWTLEVVNRSIQACWLDAQQRNETWPSVCRIFADNTPKAMGSVKKHCLCWWLPLTCPEGG